MYWLFVVIIMAIVFLCGLMIGFVLGGERRNEQR